MGSKKLSLCFISMQVFEDRYRNFCDPDIPRFVSLLSQDTKLLLSVCMIYFDSRVSLYFAVFTMDHITRAWVLCSFIF